MARLLARWPSTTAPCAATSCRSVSRTRCSARPREPSLLSEADRYRAGDGRRAVGPGSVASRSRARGELSGADRAGHDPARPGAAQGPAAGGCCGRREGRVLELGGAGGVNLEHYPAADVSEVVVVGADAAGRSRLQRVAARRGASGGAASGSTTQALASTPSSPPSLERSLRPGRGAGRALAARCWTRRPLLFLDHSPRRPGGHGHGAQPAAVAPDGGGLRSRPGPPGRGPARRLHRSSPSIASGCRR